jgi:hypothetical protein
VRIPQLPIPIELGLDLLGRELWLTGSAQFVLVSLGRDGARHLEEVGALGKQDCRALHLQPVVV